MSKKCTPLWREAHFEVKMYKKHHSRTTFGSWDVEKVTHDHPAAQPSSDQRISGSADQRISGSADQRISGSADQRISGSADYRIIGSADQRISGSADQRIIGSSDQRITGSSDQRISGSSDQRSAGQRIIGSADQRISGSADQRIIGSSDQRISGSADQRIMHAIPPRHACMLRTHLHRLLRSQDRLSMPQYTCMASGCRIIQHLSQGLQVTSTERVHWLIGIEVFGKSDSWPMAPFRFSFAHSMLHSCPTAPAEAWWSNHMADKTQSACPLAQKKEVHFGSAVAAVLYPHSLCWSTLM